jgi:hypothetical protein
MNKRIKVTINRDEWARGERAQGLMIDSRRNKCCLQFLAEACGAKGHTDPMPWDGDVLPHDFPLKEQGKFPQALFEDSPYFSTPYQGSKRPPKPQPWECAFAGINDDRGLDEPAREQAIRVGFDLVLDCDVEFVGGES